MNPVDWDAILRTVQKNLDPIHQNYVNDSMENAPRTNNDRDTYCEYSRHTFDAPQSSTGWEGVSPPLSLNLYIKDSEVEDPDGAPLELEEEDPELARKRKELREIEERILLKKAAIALKSVEPLVKKTTLSDSSCNEQSSACKGATLKDRVNVILQQRHPAGFLSKVRSPRERMNSSRLSRDGLLQDHHPLKLRVKALMKHRCSDPCVLPASREATDVPPPPPSRSDTSPAEQQNGVNEGFQLFLSVLNKGVDFDFLNRIVTNDSEDLPLGEELLNIHPAAAENQSDPPFGSESERLNGGVSLPGHSRTNSGERKTDPPSQERSLNETLPDDGEKKDDRGEANSQSRSPSAGKNNKKSEEEKPKVDEQSAQLQNILKTLGLSLEVEEMSKLADRTQERLYGKKHGDRRADRRGEQESQQRGSQRHYSHSSSSSRSTRPRSFSPSPSRRRCSHSKDSKRRSEHSHSREKSRDGPTCQDHNRDRREAQRCRDEDRDGEYLTEISTYQPPYPMYPQPHPSAFSEYSAYSLSQDSEHTAYHSGTYSAATDSYWTHTQDAIPRSLYPSEGPYPQNTYCPFPGSVVAPNVVYPHRRSLKDMNWFVNPDLSQSEGQSGSVSGLRCLQVIKTKTTESNLKQLTSGKMRRGTAESKLKSRRKRWARKKQLRKMAKIAAKQEKQSANSVEVEKALQLDEDDSEAELSEEEKQPPTETEIKANLRKTLELFNQKVKQKVPQPAIFLTPQIE
ncbi:hypothetical protein PFLUV_G00012570 [Perca fluviatilis]|uniref:Uncharacterized protein n=1 Tax=Perca fluviatilis TaxID=8168 RepID=A0A6A5FS94_PERFL|nr:uncharacterized protein LOC120564779 [Perca fluviatilis]XP_039665974.1 uncharacterized protein LOC120564779 [Perca fluviatilis]XP_039665981.1 uncharacterized protein LOC120564779 [Perca fluviatilis]XP_039665989.1 uncharacterized protein LOC120564779 [Perca fluviatilis]KAF1395541.1 hypothetical protein PFLUV_G00012570 [Perca fluviatilis]